MKQQKGGWVECFSCEEDFFVPGITEEEAKQLSKTVVLCPSCGKRKQAEEEEDQ